MFTNTKALTIPDGDVVKIECGGVVLWEKPASYKNWVQYSTENDGVTIYNGGLGYKENIRIRSGGAEASATGVVTGFIPFKKGDFMEISPRFTGLNNYNTINFFNSDFTNLGQYNDSGAAYGFCDPAYGWLEIATRKGESNVTTIDISNVTNGDDVAFIRLTHDIKVGGANLIVTVNEEIT